MVKCANCGYLAVRHTQTRELLDAEFLFRDRGYIPEIPGNGHRSPQAYDEHPVCFVGKINFRDASEVGLRSDETTRKNAVQRERECDGFTVWQIGFTPKEHRQLAQEAELRRWQEQREEADRAERLARENADREDRRERERRQAEAERQREEYEAARDKDARDFQAEQARLTRLHSDRMFRLNAASLGLAISTAIVSACLWFFRTDEPDKSPAINTAPPVATKPTPPDPTGTR